MKKIWKISNQINSTDLEIQPLECQDIFIQDFSIQKEKLMTSFLNNKSLESSNILRHSVPHFVEKAAFSKNLFKIDPKELLIEYSKIHELKLISIGLASSEKIQQWAEKILPNGKILGEVTNANTLHYKTFKPTKGGLFCERIFGPLKDFECSCGIRQRPNQQESKQIFNHLQIKRKFCAVCDVEYTWSVIRRYQLGYIRLVSPVSHLWYLRANPSYLAILLDMKRKKLENIIYCSETTTLENNWKSSQSFGFENSPTFLYLSWQQTLENRTTGTSEFKKTFLISKKSSVSILPKRIESREKQLCPIYLKEVLNSDQLQQKIEFKLKKRFIPKIWLSIWKELFRKNYINSLKQNAKIWSLLWAKYKMKSLLSLPKKFKRLPEKADSTNFLQHKVAKTSELFFQKSVPPKNLLLTSKKFDPYVLLFQNYEKNFSKNDKQFIQCEETVKNSVFNSLNSPPNFSWKVLLIHPVNRENSQYRHQFFGAPKKIGMNYFQTTFMLFFLNWLQSNSNFMRMLTFWESGRSVQNNLRNNVLNNDLNNIQKQKQNDHHKKVKQFIKQFLPFEERQKTPSVKLLNLYLLYLTKLQLKNSLVLNQQSLKQFIFDSFPGFRNVNLTKTKDRLLIRKMKYFLRPFVKKKNLSLFGEMFHYYPVLEFKLMLNKSIANDKLNLCSDDSFLLKTLIPTKEIPQNLFSHLSFSNRKTQFLFCKDRKESQSEKATFYLRRKNFQTQNRISIKRNKIDHSPGLQVAKTESTFKYVNNIYCLSYAYSWDLERDWKYFFYAISAPLAFEDSQIFCYTHRTPNISEFSSGNFITGAGLIQQLLREFQSVELKKMSKQHRILLPKIRQKIRKIRSNSTRLTLAVHSTLAPAVTPLAKTQLSEIEKLLKKRDHIMKRFKILRKMLRKNTNPSSMVLSNLPVLPPDLRPILKLQDQIAASDLNTLYQRILFRNDRLKKFLKDPAISQSFESKYAQRLLQEAVDNLIQNGKGNTKPETNSRGQPLKSLSEILKGKQGRFRQYLLGKRVDYSGRSVIVVGPNLQLHECGLPKEMAIELFLPFLIKKILHYRLAATILGAKTLIQKKDPMIWDLLRETLRNHPVLLNRAPTLHRLGIQAFQPKLVEGRAILIHPLVCPGFNADFDGDQMAVHVPITIEARIEAWKLIFSGNNLISAATGEPIVLPSQDMVLGLYYLTAEKIYANQIQKRKTLIENKNNSFYDFRAKNFMSTQFLPTDYCFSSCNQVLQAYQLNLIHAHSVIWLKWNGDVETKSTLSIPEEIQLTEAGDFEEIRSNVCRRFNSQLILIHQLVRTTPGRVFLNVKIQQYF